MYKFIENAYSVEYFWPSSSASMAYSTPIICNKFKKCQLNMIMRIMPSLTKNGGSC